VLSAAVSVTSASIVVESVKVSVGLFPRVVLSSDSEAIVPLSGKVDGISSSWFVIVLFKKVSVELLFET